LAREFPERKIYCVDSKSASIGEGLLVYNAALKKEQGMNIDDLKVWVEENRAYCRHWFTVRDLFYLKRGGRVTSIEAVVGTALKIRPVLSVDENGKLVVLSKIRGSKAELDFMLSKLHSEGVNLASQTIILGHGDNLEQVQELERQIRERGIVKDIIISKVGPIIGTHTGPGMLAMVFMGIKS
jgi:DegV family protein with EDD domain